MQLIYLGMKFKMSLHNVHNLVAAATSEHVTLLMHKNNLTRPSISCDETKITPHENTYQNNYSANKTKINTFRMSSLVSRILKKTIIIIIPNFKVYSRR